MNEHAKPFREEASEIAFRLLDRERMTAPDAPDLDVREGLYIGDVQEEARQFAGEAETLRALGLPFPAIRAPGKRDVPFALTGYSLYPGVPGPWLRPSRHPFYAEFVYDFVREWERTPSEGKTTVNVDAAVESFRAGMVEFLATRIASVAEFFGRRLRPLDVSPVSLTLPRTVLSVARVKTVGFTVDVTASTSGLRIHVSPTFRRNFRYFGMPTNPVVSTLTGGIYEFGADGGPYGMITPDPGTFDIPYQTVAPRLIL